MISVIIPNFNRASYLKEAIQSVINQSFNHWEVLVVDDGSIDDSKLTVDSFQDHRIKWIIRTEGVRGAASCRNIGIAKAQGDLIVFLDSDDILESFCLEQRFQIMNSHSQLDFAVFQMQLFQKEVGDMAKVWNIKTKESDLNRFLMLDSVWQTSGPIWRTESLKAINGFDENLQCWQDVDLHLKALIRGLKYRTFFELPVDCYYRKDAEDSISQTNMNNLAKLNSKRHLWESLQTKITDVEKLKPMLLQILISSLNGHQLSFFKELKSKNTNQLTTWEICSLNTMSFIKMLRLYRIGYFQLLYMKLKHKLVPTKQIGTHHVS